MTVEIRPAVLPDARGIAEVHVLAWQETYNHLAPVEDLARLKVEQRELRWRELLVDQTTHAWVAIVDDRIVGFAGTSRGHGSPCDLELESIYVLGEQHGTGIGQELLDAAIGTDPAYLWVAADNPRARAFYERNEFLADGEEDTHSIVGTAVLAVRLVR